ncbi:Upstream stimulatory factor 1 [Myotis davidii]|uniref:Upstream stimulatory factor 1 n=1 Tax=Myotis davidii TaxID=225400 RepID=L5LVK8_MYODS|nr:Upstream stimulatory factor 1 [Myotis davidii]
MPGSQRQVCDPSLDCSPRPDIALPESTQAVLTAEGDRGSSRGGSLGSRASAWDANTKVRSRRKCARGRQQKTAETEEGTVQIQEGAVATGEDPTSVAIASIQSSATFPDPNVKYVFRTENGGQVMYRVIQVSEGQLDGQTEGTGAISGYPATQSMTQAVIQGAFTSDDAVDTEGTAAETHYAYFPGTAVGDGAAGTTAGSAAAVVTTQGSEALLGQATPPGTGQFFVMMSPQEVLPGGSQRSIAPRTHPYSPYHKRQIWCDSYPKCQSDFLTFITWLPSAPMVRKSEAPRTTRDEKRRAQHNEVERRRRDKINNWIVQLSKIIPDCSMESTKSGQSKGGILSKACDYIQELRQSNHRLSEELQGLDQLQLDNEVLRQQVEDLKNKNLLLRAQLRHHGVEVVIKNDSS